MRSGILLFLDDENALGAKAVPASLVAHIDRVTHLDSFTESLETGRYEIALIRADGAKLFGPHGEEFRSELLSASRNCGVMIALMVPSMNPDECDKLVSEGFDDILHEPGHVSQFEAQLRSIRRISVMRRELRRRQATLRQFLAIVEDSDLDLCFSQDEPLQSLSSAEIILLDLAPSRSGATSLYPKLRSYCKVNYFDDSEQAQSLAFQGSANLTIINAGESADEALSFIAAMRASATLYNHPVLLIAEGDGGPHLDQVFAAGATDYLCGEFSLDSTVARLQSLFRHEQLRGQLASQCDRPTTAIVHDSLTKCYSYGFARAHLLGFEQAMRMHELPLTLATIGLDNLSRVNEEFGFAAGDALIRQSANIIQNCVRGEDMVARIAGSQFLLMFPETGLPQARVALNRINSILQYTSMVLPGAAGTVQAASSFRLVDWNAGDSVAAFLFGSKQAAAQAA